MRLRWGLSERYPGGPRYRAPYGANNQFCPFSNHLSNLSSLEHKEGLEAADKDKGFCGGHHHQPPFYIILQLSFYISLPLSLYIILPLSFYIILPISFYINAAAELSQNIM